MKANYGQAVINGPYYKRIQAAKAWQQEHARSPEDKIAAAKAWAQKQAARRHAEKQFHNATKTTMGQAMIRAWPLLWPGVNSRRGLF